MIRIKNIRLRQYDYHTDGYYFVTAVCGYRQNYFENRESVVEKELKDLQEKTNGLYLDYYIVMPNHVHIIFILRQCSLGLGEVVRRLKAKVSRSFGENVWQPNYYEHVIRNEKALEKIRAYIINNPQELVLEFRQFYV